MKKVTFKSVVKIGGTPWNPKSTKTFEIIEYTEADESSIRLRAMALNWTVVSIENCVK